MRYTIIREPHIVIKYFLCNNFDTLPYVTILALYNDSYLIQRLKLMQQFKR
jgi:hypothetical protein